MQKSLWIDPNNLFWSHLLNTDVNADAQTALKYIVRITSSSSVRKTSKFFYMKRLILSREWFHVMTEQEEHSHTTSPKTRAASLTQALPLALERPVSAWRLCNTNHLPVQWVDVKEQRCHRGGSYWAAQDRLEMKVVTRPPQPLHETFHSCWQAK